MAKSLLLLDNLEVRLSCEDLGVLGSEELANAVPHLERPKGRVSFRASFQPRRKPALQFALAGRQSGGFQNVSERWIVIQREQKCKAI